MSTLSSDYLERVYAGLLGKMIGIRLGAPVEPAIWTYERIREVYGDITSYLKPYRNFAADDDANGPVYFIRPLLDKVERLRDADAGSFATPLSITPEDVGRAWLGMPVKEWNVLVGRVRQKHRAHTAYLNLQHGVPAPESGSIARNGVVSAEQIGGQIFIDTGACMARGP